MPVGIWTTCSINRHLDDLFGELDVWLGAENGVLLRLGGRENEWLTVPETVDLQWMDSVGQMVTYEFIRSVSR